MRYPPPVGTLYHMAQHADPTGVPKKKRGPRPRYSWNEWTDGEWWYLRQGSDYEVGTESFRSTAANYGLRHGFQLTSQATADGIFIRFTPKESK